MKAVLNRCKPLHVKGQFRLRWVLMSALLIAGCFWVINGVNAQTQKKEGVSSSKEVSGRVLDSKGEPIIGSSVVVKGTSNGTITDVKGKYTITTKENAVLTFSYVGCDTKEIAVGGQSVINVTLSESTQTIDEVVVVGYGTLKKSDLTGAISSVNSKDLKNQTVRSATEALQGKTAGIAVTSTSGSPGSLPAVRIRGIGTLNGTDPLYVVDGFPQGDISWLNANDIASMEVLKDASACAIYGSRGANGVIMVTTKKGTISDVHKMNIAVDVTYGVSKVAKTYDMMNAEEFINYRNLAYKNGGSSWEAGTHKDEILSFLKENFGSTEGTNWQKEIFRTAPTQNYNITLTNGSKYSSFFSSLSYLNQEGIVKGSDFERISWRNTIDNQLSKRAKLSANFSVVYQQRHNIDESNINTGTIYSALAADPVTPVYRTNLKNIPSSISDLFCLSYLDMSNSYSYYSPILFNNKINPVAQCDIMHQSVWKDVTFRGGISADIDLVGDWLKYKGTVNAQIYRATPEYFTPKYYLGAYQNDTDGQVGNACYTTNYFVVDNVLTFDKSYKFKGKQHSIFMLGNSIERTYDTSFSAYKTGVVTNDEAQRIIDAATLTSSVSGSKSESFLTSYFGRLNHTMEDKYMLTATLRYDGSSNFSTEHKWALFPSASLGYVFSEEKFVKKLTGKFLSSAKLRASWGQIGNQVISGGSYLTQYSLNEGYYLFGNASNQTSQLSGGRSSVGNADVKWETTEQTDLGLDLNFFDYKLTCTFDFFYKKTKDMLLEIPLPTYLGYPNDPVQNVGSIQNTGIELALNYKGKIGKVEYSVGGNISTAKNKVISLGGDLPIMGGYYSPNFYDFTKTEEGQPIGYFYGYKTNGIFQSQSEIDNYTNAQGKKVMQEDARPGDIRYVDVNGDGEITADDKTKIGNPFPDFTYGLTLGANYKGFDIALTFYGVQGNDIMNVMKLDFYSGTAYYNAPKDLMTKAWSTSNPSNTQFQISTESANNLRVSDWLVEDGSYFQLKNLQIGYSLPAKWTRIFKMQDCRFWIGATNLFTLTKYTGMSPEIGDSSPTSSGIDIAFYPQAIQFQMGLNVKF
jgi:TonB-dependent starch-binding outer membrane protein SusC